MNQNIFSGKYILPFSLAALVLVAGGVFAFNQMNQGPEPQPTPTPSPAPTTKTLSLESWETFNGEAEGLKRGITFLYPSDWGNLGVSCGGPGCGGHFKENDSNLVLWTQAEALEKSPLDFPGVVGYISVRSSGSVFNQVKDFVLINENNVTIDGYEGRIIQRSVPLVDGTERKEWWLILPEVEGSLGTTVMYELYMADIYENSKEAFMKLINSVQIEPFDTFKLKP